MKNLTLGHARSRRVASLAMAGVLATSVGIAAYAESDGAHQDSEQQHVDTEMTDAISRDLGLSDEQVRQELAQEDVATKVDAVLSQQLGDDFGGSYFDADTGLLNVAVTDKERFAEVQAEGATPRVVARSEADLHRIQTALDAEVATGSDVTQTGVDTVTNQVVIAVLEGSKDQAREVITAAGVAPETVRIETTAKKPQTTAASGAGGGSQSISGGNSFENESTGRYCTVGLKVEDENGNEGFLTAGHCGDRGDSVRIPTARTGGGDGVFISSTVGSLGDYAFVRLDAPLRMLPRYVRQQARQGLAFTPPSYRGVTGVRSALPRSIVCTYGWSSGYVCGRVTATNQTLNFDNEASIRGLTTVNMCVTPGDSGGPVMTATSSSRESKTLATGILQGNGTQFVDAPGDTDCGDRPVAYYQPVVRAARGTNTTLRFILFDLD